MTKLRSLANALRSLQRKLPWFRGRAGFSYQNLL
jgi:hypothetical protein